VTTRPGDAARIESLVENRLHAVLAETGSRETVTVEWRDAVVHLPVISMPVDALYYNPATHRIRAQRSLDPDLDVVLDNDPYGDAAQGYLHQLLKGDPSDPRTTDPAFELLKADLQEHGQSEPGIVTRWGELINGNTRRAALSELQVKNIRVGVLPSDAGAEDIRSVELALQLRRDHKRDYSFMNELLAIDERIRAGRPAAEIMYEFRIRQQKFDRSRWILGLVREAIERSRISGENGGDLSLKLVDFETHQGKLEELFRAYSSLKLKDPDKADALREQRLLALILNKSKTDLRYVDAEFADTYAASLLAGTPGTERTVTIPGLGVTVPGASAKVDRLRAVTTQVLQARVAEAAGPAAAAGVHRDAVELLDRTRDVVESGLRKAGKDGRVLKKKLEPVDRLGEASEALDMAATAIADARATGNYDPATLDEALGSIRRSLVTLARVILRGQDEELPATEWLTSLIQSPEVR
jgi:hypothetical protein